MAGLLVLALCALTWGGAHAQEMALHRDGAWLQDGIELYHRMSGHENLSENEAGRAQVVVSYVCAVVDLEKYLVFRAALLNGAVAEAKEDRRMNPMELRGIGEALPLLLPLMATRFFADNPPCDTVLLMVRDYLLEYPELLAQDAGAVVEGALLHAYSDRNEP